MGFRLLPAFQMLLSRSWARTGPFFTDILGFQVGVLAEFVGPRTRDSGKTNK